MNQKVVRVLWVVEGLGEIARLRRHWQSTVLLAAAETPGIEGNLATVMIERQNISLLEQQDNLL